ncbi:capsular exopolysaccharide family protein [Hyphomicrobium denitrificans 1NES1]|uniref:non-specific protein-tyrosine kinase n=1 Tax=Hyphomicrobium denitrificans 1NES1 TaxID=670307 RepID=N0B356_9HYPH|nr:polysaccharide biosynthesis tyrosine autokinase [Hyphomicrobium denitrificans]AGK56637.1 capsular exopolysaccharide family protein [Hyphomicrobium denitrificans 1NES1]
MAPSSDENQNANDANSTQLEPASGPGSDIAESYRLLHRTGRDFGREETDIAAKIWDYWRIFNKRKWLILAIASCVLAIGAIRTLMTTPLYTSTIRLQIDRNVAKIVDGGSVTPVEGTDNEFLKTQYELLQSRSLAERVASAARLADDPDFIRPREFSLFAMSREFLKTSTPNANRSRRALTDAAAAIVQRNVSVRPIAGSRLVDVSYSDPDPARSQKIASAYADAFIASNLDKRFEANAYAKTFLEDQIKQLKLKLEQSEKTMLDFAEKEQIVATHQNSSITEADLGNANAALGNVTSERIRNEQLWRQVEKSDAISLPQFLSNAVIDGLRTKRNELVTNYQEKLETFKPGYPAMIQISNKIAEIDKQLAAEVKTIRASLKGAYESSLSQERELKARVDKLRAEVLDVQKRSIKYNILKREVDTNRGLYNDLLQRFKEVDVAGGVGSNNIFIVDKADLPGAPSSPKLLRSMLIYLLLGSCGGFGLAYILEELDDVIDSIEEAERIGGLATLGIIPFTKAEGGAEADLKDVRSTLSEAYRSLCTSLQFSTARGMPKSLLITSADAAEGKSITSLAITQHFSRLGLKVLLVDADMRNPSLHKVLQADNSVGLSSCLAGTCNPPEAIQTTDISNLAFLPSGPLPPNAADLLSSPHLMSLLTLSLQVFDLVIIDGPPVLGIADAPLLSNAAEATVFVIGAGIARAGSVRGALKRLDIAKSPMIGSVVTRFDAKRAGYGYGRYGYGYGRYGYGYGFTYGERAFSYGKYVPGFDTPHPMMSVRENPR